MFLLRSSIVLGVIFALAALSSPTEGAQKKGKKKGGEHIHRGIVENVNHKSGTFTIKAHHHRKRSGGKALARRAQGAGKRKSSRNLTFQVTPQTKFQGGSFKNLHRGKHVVVMAQGHRADDVKLGQGKGSRPKRKKNVV